MIKTFVIAAALLFIGNGSATNQYVNPLRFQGYTGVVTEYCDSGIAASGRWTMPGTAAASYDIPLGSLVYVNGYGTVLIDDRGRAGLFTIDIYNRSCYAARQWGREYRYIDILRRGW